MVSNDGEVWYVGHVINAYDLYMTVSYISDAEG